MNFLYGVPGKQTIYEHALKGQTMTALGKTQGEKTITIDGHALKGQTMTALGETQEKNNQQPTNMP